MNARPRMLYDTIILNIGTLLLSQETQKNSPFYRPFQTISMISVAGAGMLLSTHLLILNHLFY